MNTIWIFGLAFVAVFSIFASKLSLSMIIRSASLNFIISEGISSNVWEFTPSGTKPTKLILSPPIFWTIFVMGATEVATFSFLLFFDCYYCLDLH